MQKQGGTAALATPFKMIVKRLAALKARPSAPKTSLPEERGQGCLKMEALNSAKLLRTLAALKWASRLDPWN